MHPIESINQEEITLSINGREAVALMELIKAGLSTKSVEDVPAILSIVKKLSPGIKRQAAKQERIQHDKLN